MMTLYLSRIRLYHQGYSLIGVIVSMAIVGMIVGCLSSVIVVMTDVHGRASTEFPALANSQAIAYRMSRDAQMAQSLSTDDAAGTPETEVLTLSWVGWPRSDIQDNLYYDSYEIRYTHDNNEVFRRESVTTDKYNASGDFVSSSQTQADTFIADSISAMAITIETPPDSAASEVVCTITTSEDQCLIVRTYRLTQRAI